MFTHIESTKSTCWWFMFSTGSTWIFDWQVFFFCLGLLWNLSSVDSLKPDLLKSALPVLMERVILPYTKGHDRTNSSSRDPEVFFNATACLRWEKHFYWAPDNMPGFLLWLLDILCFYLCVAQLRIKEYDITLYFIKLKSQPQQPIISALNY